MKKLYFLLFATVLTTTLFAQEEPANCFEEYKQVFENRGAFEVKDGEHDNVILSVRSKEGVECFLCVVTMHNKTVQEIAIYYEDDTKDIIEYDFKDDVDWTVIQGISRTRITKNNEQINLMFTNSIKPKKKAYKKAPLPKFDLND